MINPALIQGVTGSQQPYTPVANTASGAAQTNTATLTAVAGKQLWLEGFDITGGGATAASVIEITVSNLITGTLKYEMNVAAGVAASVNAQGGLFIRLPSPLQATAGQNITVSAPTFGAGNTNAAVTAYGFTCNG